MSPAAQYFDIDHNLAVAVLTQESFLIQERWENSMNTIIGTWLLVGFVVHKYYIYVHDSGRLYKEYMNSKYTLTQYILGYVLTLLLWPVTIYNMETRGKDD